MSTNFSEKNSQVISGISQLQQKERDLYNSLEDTTISSNERKEIINKINNLSQIRLNMYSTLQNMYSSYDEGVNNLDTTLNTQLNSINQIENELNQSKLYLNSVDQLKVDKLRVIEINNYYAKRYNAYKGIMFLISITCLPILILTILNNNSIVSSSIYQLIVGIIILISSYTIFRQYADISNRDNLNWDSYSWYFNKNDAPKPENSSDENNNGNDDEDDNNENDVCIGESCCTNGTIYDYNLQKCIPNPYPNKCNENEHYDISKQMCVPITCPSDATYDKYNKMCDCPDGKVFDYDTNTCKNCPSGSKSSINPFSGETCECSENYVYNKNTYSCVACPSGSTYNSTYKSCECPENYVYKMKTNECINCPSGSKYQPETKTCKCPTNFSYNSYESTCQLCPETSKYNNSTNSCDCLDPNAYYDSQSNTCKYKYNF